MTAGGGRPPLFLSMNYKVRDHFYVHMDGRVYEPGAELELDEQQAARYAAQIEPVAPAKPSKKVTADDAK